MIEITIHGTYAEIRGDMENLLSQQIEVTGADNEAESNPTTTLPKAPRNPRTRGPGKPKAAAPTPPNAPASDSAPGQVGTVPGAAAPHPVFGPEGEQYKLDDVKNALLGYMERNAETPADAPKCKALLAKFNAVSISKLETKQYSDFIAACTPVPATL
jgi:hypothetical protein